MMSFLVGYRHQRGQQAFLRSRNATPDISDLFMPVSQEFARRANAVLQEYLHRNSD